MELKGATCVSSYYYTTIYDYILLYSQGLAIKVIPSTAISESDNRCHLLE